MNSYEIIFNIGKSVFERGIDPRFFIDDLREIGECEVEVSAENIPSIDDIVDDSHSFIAKVILKSEKFRADVEEVLEFVISEGVTINTIHEEKHDSENIDIVGEEIPKKLIENYFLESKSVISRLNNGVLEIHGDRENRELLNGLFREFHTLKGGTGVLLSYKITPITEAIKNIAHLAEGMLVKFRDSDSNLTDEDIEVVQHAIDRLDDLLSAFEQNLSFDEDDVEEILEILKQKSNKEITHSHKVDNHSNISMEVLKEVANQYLPIYIEIVTKSNYDEAELEFLSNSIDTLFKIARDNHLSDIENIIRNLVEPINLNQKEKLLLELANLVTTLQKDLNSAEAEKNGQKEIVKIEKDASKYVQKSSSLRIDEKVVNELMNLVGEMSVFKEWIGFFSNKLYKEYGNQEASKELKEKYQRFRNLVNSMQNSVLEMRMMPLSTLFERFPKLVRDLSRTLTKKIEFKVEGAETRLDKVIIEKIGEPMVHLIRNSIDHGIESPQNRLEVGKSDTGTLTIKAYQLAGNVFIEVIDDGGGINTEVVAKKALEKGLIDEDKLKSMSEDDINALVMLAGFSTKDVATEVSGRGVGTDAVATAVRSVGGEIKLQSKKGIGTKFILELPLTLAIQKILLCKISGSVYGIPADSISEIIKIESEKIAYFKDLHLFIHRGDTVVIDYADQKLNLSKNSNSNELTLLIDNSKKRAIAVESLLNTIDTVVKPTPDLISDVSEVIGVTILGDGTIVYILDL